MRDYALSQSRSRDAAGAWPWLGRLLRNWQARRTIQRLASCDDYMLADIGVQRLDVEWAAGLPLTVNAALALEERSFRRQRMQPQT